MAGKQTLLLSSKQVQSLIDLPEVINLVEEAFRAHGLKQVSMPAKITLDLRGSGFNNWMNAMPAFVESIQASGIKWAGGFPHNPSQGLGYVQGLIILNDPKTGVPLSIMDGVWITNARTGSVVAVAARHLSNPGPLNVAIVGAGTQARWALRALRREGRVAKAYAYDVRPEAATAYTNEMAEELFVEVQPTETVQQAVESAHLIVTATTADEPLVQREWVQPGTVVVSLGSYQELDEELVLQADKLVVDHLAQNRLRGELKKLYAEGRITDSDIHAELGDIVVGSKRGRESQDEIIVACLIGMASQDMVVAQHVYRRALDQGVGMTFHF